MAHFVFNKEDMEFRYGSGETVYSERFLNGRLVCRDYHAAGLPQQLQDTVSGGAMPVFRLEVDGCDTSFGWKFESWQEIKANKGQPCARLELCHAEYALRLVIETATGENGCFSRRMWLTNESEKMQAITRVSPLCGSLWEMVWEVNERTGNMDKPAYSVGYFKAGGWGTEGNFCWQEVPYNAELAFSSRIGKSGPSHPFAIARSHILGGYFIGQLEWSGNWRFDFENDYFHQSGDAKPQYLRLLFDLAPDAPAPMRVMDPGETVALPAVHFGYIYDDFDGAIQALHQYQRQWLTAKPAEGYERVVYDHWGFMEHRFTQQTLIEEVERAASIGCEVFEVDAGWYGRKEAYWAETTGDWNICRLPNDLTPVIDRVHELGMKFGLWLEPESMGAQSELYKAHPDWLMERYGEKLIRCLDMSKPEVETYVEKSLMDVIRRYKLDLFRLDFNNLEFEGGFNRHGSYLENTLWRHVEATHRIFDHIHAAFPELELENCSGGGGRTDLGQMTRFSKTQISDWNRLPRIVRIFNGISLCLPPECLMILYGAVMSSHCVGGAEMQMQIMVQGVPSISGLAPNGEAVNPFYRKRLAEYVALYKDYIRPIQKEARVFHHTPALGGLSGRGWAVIENMTPGGLKGYVFLGRLSEDGDNTYLFRPRGLDMTRYYSITFFSTGKKVKASGFELISSGLPVYLAEPLLSQLLLVEAE